MNPRGAFKHQVIRFRLFELVTTAGQNKNTQCQDFSMLKQNQKVLCRSIVMLRQSFLEHTISLESDKFLGSIGIHKSNNRKIRQPVVRGRRHAAREFLHRVSDVLCSLSSQY